MRESKDPGQNLSYPNRAKRALVGSNRHKSNKGGVMKPSVYRAKAEALFGDKSAEEMQAMADELSDGSTPEIALTRTAFTRLVAAAMEQGFKDGRTDRRTWLDNAVVH